MPNSELKQKQFKLPDNIIKFLLMKSKGSEGNQMASNLSQKGYITYEHIKKLLSKEFNEFKTDWDFFKIWCTKTLQDSRDKIQKSKETMDNAGFDNAYRKPRKLTENEKKQSKAAVGFIINDKKQILIVKRNPQKSWMGGKWACVGGSIEDNETPLQAFKREVMEETNLKIKKVSYCFKKNENNNECYYFKATASNNDEIKLNNEHTDYKWVSTKDFENLTDTTPDLYKDLVNCFTK